MRLKELQHFKDTERSRRQQEYNAIRANVNPTTYDDRLDGYHSHVCEGTGKWLLEDSVFKRWLDPADQTTRVLWIQGIPGAGKTFLAGAAVDEARAHGHTAFAFLRHDSSSGTRALTVLNSLIFQLAGHQEDLQAAVIHLPLGHIKSDLKAGEALLKSLLDCTGTAYLVIDGIDETDEIERQHLLRTMCNLAQQCPDMRILLSSRQEADIQSILEPVSTSIRVDERNKESIKAFVDARRTELFNSSQFPETDRDEITSAFSHIPSKAKGMFLYASLVLKDIEFMDDIGEIREYLKVLPEDLDGVYARVLARIEKLRPHIRDKARAVLGWVGCAPTPLTIQEIQHVLSIRPGDLEPSKPVSAKPNLNHLCGPIVEVVDDRVEFVHFTVKEYIFSGKIKGNIRESDATSDLAMRCMTLLSQVHYDTDTLEDSDTFTNLMLDGYYNLHWFAYGHWFALVKKYLEQVQEKRIEPSRTFEDSVKTLISTRANSEFAPESGSFIRSIYPDSFAGECQELSEFLGHIAQFADKCSQNSYHVTRDTSWHIHDPLTTFQASLALYNKMEVMMCRSSAHGPGCLCDIIKENMGKRPFKCGFLNCSLQRQGFNSNKQRAAHEKQHSRAWTCSTPGCEYEKTGFLSERMRDEHLRNAHKPETQRTNALDVSSRDAGDDILIDLIRAGEFEMIQHIFRDKKPPIRSNIMSAVGRFGDPAMARFFLFDSDNRSSWLAGILAAAISAGNINLVESLLKDISQIITPRWTLYRDAWRGKVIAAFIESDIAQMDVLCQRYVRGFAHCNVNLRYQVALSCFTRKAIATTGRIQGKENLLISIWDFLVSNKWVKPTYLSTALGTVASTTCSIQLGKELLKYGAEIQGSTPRISPLQVAARKSSAENAEFMKFLLLSGANPYATSRGKKTQPNKKVSDEKGAQEISQWLGVSWEELVSQTQINRKTSDS
ncbi:hypothetical protein BDV18DRAFT_151222 [Aspergillus unguis]